MLPILEDKLLVEKRAAKCTCSGCKWALPHRLDLNVYLTFTDRLEYKARALKDALVAGVDWRTVAAHVREHREHQWKLKDMQIRAEEMRLASLATPVAA